MSKATKENAMAIVKRLVDAGYEALFAGGCVRDMVMGQIPEDYDIATSAPPGVIAELFERTIAVGMQFGVMVVMMDHVPYEVATFRNESDYRDGRRPSRVSFTDAKGDVLRRDFTVNGMLYDPLDGEVIDHVGGRGDIRRRVIRCIGDPAERFAEDSLRLLRAVRFATRLGYEIEPETADAMRLAAPSIERVSPERTGQEICKMLTGPTPHKAVEWMDRTELLEAILPEVAAMKGVEQPKNFHPEGDVYRHTLLALELMDSERERHEPSCEFALAVLLHDVGKPSTFERADRIRFNLHSKVGADIAEAIARRLRLSRRQVEHISKLVSDHMRLSQAMDMREGRLKRLMRQDDFPDHLQLFRIDCLASHSELDAWDFCRKKLDELAEEPEPPPPLLTGHDLIEMGYKPGPVFSRILTAIDEARLDGLLHTSDDARRLAREKFPPQSDTGETA